MIGALYTGISGLAAQQKALDNESNNIANVNTIGYKTSRISFADQLYQDKIGKGTSILDAEKLYTQGNLKLTGVAFDVALSGDGFFSVSNTRSSGTAQTFYTRAGNFRMGDNGTLQDSAGNEVQGWAMSKLDPNADVTSTNANIKKFTNNYNKLAASQIIGRSTAVETITAKMTDYTTSAKSDDLSIMTGAGYKTKSEKISDIELLISSYSSALQVYSSSPDATSTPSVAQNSWLNFDLNTATVDSGDQIYVFVNGTKYAQSFDTSEQITMKKLVDQLSNVPGLNAYIGASTSATFPTPTDTNGYVVLESLIPGQNVTIGDVGIVHNSATTLKTSGTNTAAVAGTGFGAVNSAMEALKTAVSGKQTNVWSNTELGTLGTGTVGGVTTGDKLTYSLSSGINTYTISIIQGANTITTDTSDANGVATLGASLSDANKVDSMVTAINSHSEMAKSIIARNINGNLVIESLNTGVEFTGALTVDYASDAIANTGTAAGTAGTALFALAGKVVNTDEEVTMNLTVGLNSYTATIKGGSKQATVVNNTTGATSNVTLSTAVTSANAAGAMAYTLENGDTTLAAAVVAAQNGTTSTTLNLGDTLNISGLSLTIGANLNAATKNNSSTFSINSGAGAEFMQIKSTIDQTASKGSLQLRLDTLGISDSAFGNFAVDTSGLITMQQDGATFAIGQMAIALFNDNRGLTPQGDNLLASTTRSGSAIYNINNNKTASVKSKTLELSTADLSTALVNLMVFQRAFEANAKSITTADKILSTLINLKR